LGRVYFAVFGSGLGHATRAVDISAKVRGGGAEVVFSSSGQGLGYLRKHAPDVQAVECPHLDVEWTEEGSFSSKGFVVHFPYMFRSFAHQVAFESRSVARAKPSVVVSDSKLSAVLAGRQRSVPVVTILNQFKVTLPPRYRGGEVGALYERIAGDVLGLLWSLSDQVLLTDLPPPYTIGESNVEGTDLTRIVKYVGFTTPSLEVNEEKLAKAKALVGTDRRPLVFVQISGPDATKRRFADIVLRSAEELSGRCRMVVSLGYLGGSGEPRTLASGGLLYDWCPIKDELFLLSDAMVARAGHRTIGQCIDTGKPAVLVPIHNHSEQIGNADKFQRLGLGVSIHSQDLTPEALAAAIDACLTDPSYKERLEAVGAVSSRYRGIDAITAAVRSYV